jgi:hypothetical protein
VALGDNYLRTNFYRTINASAQEIAKANNPIYQ